MVKKFFTTKFRVSTDYLIVLTTILSGVVVMSAFFGVSSYKNNHTAKNNSLKQEALQAENLISEIISEHHWQMRSVAEKIMKSDGSSEKISKIISDHNKFDTNSNFDQFLNQKDLFWVDSNDNITIKNKVGILHFPSKISKSYEVYNSREEPWKLIISKELPYSQKDYNLILTSFGVTDNNGKYLGSIVSSIDVNMIQNILTEKFTNLREDKVLILSSYDNSIVFQSDLINPIQDQKFFLHKLGNINYKDHESNFLASEFMVNGINFSYYKKLTDYPFVVLSGYDYKLYKSNLHFSLLKAIYPNFLVGFLLILTLFFFYKRIVQPINQLSIIAKKIGSSNEPFDIELPKINSPELFSLCRALVSIKTQKIKEIRHYQELEQAKNRLEEALDIIRKSDIAQIELIKQIRKDIIKNTSHVYATLKMLKHNIDTTHDSNSNNVNTFLLKSIEQAVQNITEFATDELNKEHADIRSIVSRALLSQKKEITTRNIRFDVIYDKNTPKLVFVDQVRLTQIISAILNKTIPLLNSKNSFTIHVKSISKNKEKKLSISIIDDGMGIGFKDFAIAAEQIGKRNESSLTGIDISVETIEDLINLHNGEINYKNQIQKGSTTTIIIPYIKKLEKVAFLSNKNYKLDNVIPFPIQKKDQ